MKQNALSSHWSCRRAKKIICGFIPFAFGFLALELNAGDFAINWFTTDAGGGSSTGGVYSVSGTIGQPDACGPMAGGSFSITGGFWSLLSVVQSPGAPLLTISLSVTNAVVVSWPAPSSGFELQQSTNMSSVTWGSPAEVIVDNGTNRFIIVNPPAGNRFYRLKSQP